MNKEKFAPNSWKVMMIISIIFIIWILFMMSGGNGILPAAFKLAGSTQLTIDIEKKALDFMNMTMLKPLWEELWIGIFGLVIALGLRKKMRFAWSLGLFWGIMMITNAVIQGGYEILILGWMQVCLQTYMFLLLGLISVINLYSARKEYNK